jgi:hypothetical protein
MQARLLSDKIMGERYRNFHAQLPLSLGGTGQDGRHARTVRAAGAWAQFQSVCAGLFQEGQGGGSVVGRLRGESRSAANSGQSMKDSTLQASDGDFRPFLNLSLFPWGAIV